MDRRLPDDASDLDHPSVRWVQIDLADPVTWFRRDQEVLDHLRNVPRFAVSRLLDRHRERIEVDYAAIFEGEAAAEV